MSRVTAQLSISLDGFLAGPDQSADNPLGIGGQALHDWVWHADDPGHEADKPFRDDAFRPRAAYIMGRNMFGPVRGEWHGDWRGWWGDDPPYHAPVFVLTHHARDPLAMQGGTTFHFVTDGFDAAFSRATVAAGDGEIAIAGGASTVRQAIAAAALDEVVLHIAPVLLGAGERLFDGVADPGVEPVDAVHSPFVTHIRYRIAR